MSETVQPNPALPRECLQCGKPIKSGFWCGCEPINCPEPATDPFEMEA